MNLERSTGIGELLRAVLAALDAAEVRWALLRGRADLGSAGHDVDLLVARDDVAAAEDVVFGFGGVALPMPSPPWHRFYVLTDPASGAEAVLDVVCELVYGRRILLHSGLETVCLDRGTREAGLSVLDPADAFWTILLHSLLDKDTVTEQRRAELRALLDAGARPSPCRTFVEAICPPGWSPERVLAGVAEEEWTLLSHVGRLIVGPRPGSRRSALVALRAAMARPLRALYAFGWRRAGLGVTPHVLDVAERTPVDDVLLDVRRRPWRCDVRLLVPDAQTHRLADALREDHYLGVLGAWVRPTTVGVERVRVIPSSTVGLSADAWWDLWLSSPSVPGRLHTRRASAGPEGRTGRRPRRKRRGRSVRVSFSGLDGAGKSSQIRTLTRALPECFSVDVLWMPTKIWPEPLLNQLPAGFRSRLGPRRTIPLPRDPADQLDGVAAVRTDAVRETRPARGLRGMVRSAAWVPIAVVAAISVGLSLRRRAANSSAEVVVLDRYRLDSLVKLQCWYPEVPGAWLARIVEMLAPPPDVEFLLRVDPDVAYRRKPEQWSVRQLSTHARRYDHLAQRGNVVTLDGHEDPDQLARTILSQVGAVLDAG